MQRGNGTDVAVVDDEQIIRLYRDQCQTAAEISVELGCSPSTVYFRLGRLGIVRRPSRPRRSARPADSDLRHLYLNEGHSLRQIATQFGVSAQAVRRWLLDARIPLRRPGAPAPCWTTADLVAGYQAGASAGHVAQNLGCSTASVYRALDDAGIARRPVLPGIGREALIEGLDRGLSAPEIAAAHSVSVTCVCRALARHGLATPRQTARQQKPQSLTPNRRPSA